MEKDILIQNLRTKVGEDNCKVISDKTFDGIAESVLPMFADDSKITDDTYKLPVAALIQFAGQKRFDEKEFTEKFKTEYATQHEKDVEERIRKAAEKALEDYKKEHPDKNDDGKGGKSDDDDTKNKPDIAELVKEEVKNAFKGLTGEDSELGKLTKTLTAMIQSQQDRDKTEVKNKVKAALKAHLVSLKANNEACIDDALDDIDFGDTPTFEGLKQSAISAYEKRYKRYYADGGQPFGGKSTGGGGDENSFVKSRLDKLKKEAEENASYAAEQEKTFC